MRTHVISEGNAVRMFIEVNEKKPIGQVSRLGFRDEALASSVRSGEQSYADDVLAAS